MDGGEWLSSMDAKLGRIAKALERQTAPEIGPETGEAVYALMDRAFREMELLDPERDLRAYIEEFYLTHDLEELAKACYFKGVTALSNNLRDSIRGMQE